MGMLLIELGDCGFDIVGGVVVNFDWRMLVFDEIGMIGEGCLGRLLNLLMGRGDELVSFIGFIESEVGVIVGVGEVFC